MIETPLEALMESGLDEKEAVCALTMLGHYGYIVTRVSDESLRPFKDYIEKIEDVDNE